MEVDFFESELTCKGLSSGIDDKYVYFHNCHCFTECNSCNGELNVMWKKHWIHIFFFL